jgi:predicted class III extradiol MEMO1 family dioxygenase
MLRHPAVAGQFYKGSPEALKKQVEAFIDLGAERSKAIGILAPHAGLIYSGAVAGAVYSRLELPDTVVLIGPNHTGLGAAVSLMARGDWETPLGTVTIDERLSAAILARSPRIREDTLAHLHEHSLEVQLPFIQFFKRDFKIVPMQMLDTRLETCLEVGRAVGEAIRERSQVPEVRSQKSGQGENPTPHPEPRTLDSKLPLIVASSDMSHYESAFVAKEKDYKAIDKILKLDPEGLHRTVKDNSITMCGYGPAVAMLVAARLLGAVKAELVKYANSGEVSGDYEQVVGYAGIVIR